MLCPHCNQTLVTRTFRERGVDFEYCGVCKAAWFDRGELPRLLGRPEESAVSVPDNPIRLDRILCPPCSTPLHMFAYPGTGRVVEGCESCGGIWIDREDLEEIRTLPVEPAAEDVEEVRGSDEVPRSKPAARGAEDSEAPSVPKRSASHQVSSSDAGRTTGASQELVSPDSAPRPAVIRERIRFSETYGLGFSKLLLQASSLRIDQGIPHWAESKLRLVVPSSYRVRSLRGSTLGWVEEQGEGLRAMIRRTVRREERSFVMHVAGAMHRETILQIRREGPMLSVETGRRRLGSVRRQGEGPPNGWALFDVADREFASILFRDRPPVTTDGTSPTDWEFPIVDRSSAELGTITKKWAGVWKETTTDSDNFRVDYGAHRWTPEQRAVIFAAVFAIDFDLFEDDHPGDGPT